MLRYFVKSYNMKWKYYRAKIDFATGHQIIKVSPIRGSKYLIYERVDNKWVDTCVFNVYNLEKNWDEISEAEAFIEIL